MPAEVGKEIIFSAREDGTVRLMNDKKSNHDRSNKVRKKKPTLASNANVEERRKFLKKRIEEYRHEMAADLEKEHNLQDIKSHLMKEITKSMQKMDQAKMDCRNLEVKVQNEKKKYDLEHGKNVAMEQKIKSLEVELSQVKTMTVAEKSKYAKLVESCTISENRLKQELQDAENQFEERTEELLGEIERLERENDSVVKETGKLGDLREENETVKAETEKLIKHLKDLKAYKLHKAMNKTVTAAREETEKTHKIIACLQEKQRHINEHAEELAVLRDGIKAEFLAAENLRLQLLGAINMTSEAVGNGKRLSPVDEKAGNKALADFPNVSQMKQSRGIDYNDLDENEQNEVRKMKEIMENRKQELQDLRNGLVELKKRNRENELKLRDKLQTERDALIQYSQHLEQRKSVLEKEIHDNEKK
eukprot:g1138.t1